MDGDRATELRKPELKAGLGAAGGARQDDGGWREADIARLGEQFMCRLDEAQRTDRG